VELRLQFYTRKEHEEAGQLARPRIESTGREECNLK